MATCTLYIGKKEAAAKGAIAGRKSSERASSRLVKIDGEVYPVDEAARLCGRTREALLRLLRKGRATMAELAA